MKTKFAALMLFVGIWSTPTVLAQVAVSDSMALVDLFNSTEGLAWTETWDLHSPVNSWHGIAISQEKVISIDLVYNDLKGFIPESIGNLSSLRELYLGDNQLSQTIPESIGNLSNLEDLDLATNQLAGVIPASIGNLSKLKYLVLHSNHLSGAIPESLGNLSNLFNCSLYGNQLQGGVPESFGSLSNLYQLDLGLNLLSGPIPASVGRLPNLNFLYLFFNHFTFASLETFVPVAKANPMFLDLTYTPQANIPVTNKNGKLYVSPGGTPTNNTVSWYKQDSEAPIIVGTDTSFAPTESGKYYATVTNSLVPDLILTSDAAFLKDLHICPSSGISLMCDVTGSQYQWQVKLFGQDVWTDVGSDFNGSQTATLSRGELPGSFAGSQFRCQVSNGQYSSIYTVSFREKWTGAVSNQWDNAANWDCGVLPDGNTDVIINNGTINVTGIVICRSLLVTSPDAKVTVAAGGSLTITH